MTVIFQVFVLISLASVALCDQQQAQQQQDVQFTLSGWLPKVRRTFRSMSPVVGNRPVFGNPLTFASNNAGMPEYSLQLRPRIPRLSYMGNYQQQLPYYPSSPSMTRSYRRLRSGLPSAFSMDNVSGDEGVTGAQQPTSEQLGRLRFLGWLFGRPSMSPYGDYSMLEEAAGISPYGSRFPYTRPHSPVVVEECVEMLDPYTHHIIEECQDVPTYYH